MYGSHWLAVISASLRQSYELPTLPVTAEWAAKRGPELYRPFAGCGRGRRAGSGPDATLPTTDAGRHVLVGVRHVQGFPYDPTLQRGGHVDRVVTSAGSVCRSGEVKELPL
jgi:hypothetical protein